MKLAVEHPSAIIKEEMATRGWSSDELAVRMGGEPGRNRLVLDLYFEIGPERPNMLLGDVTAAQLGKAFSVPPRFFGNLHAAWLRSMIAVVPDPTPPAQEGRDG